MWEDCRYRVEALNILLHIAKEVEEHLNSVKKHIEMEEYVRAIDTVDELLHFLTDSISQYLQSPLKHPNMNQLDMKIRMYRQTELNVMMNDANSTMQVMKKSINKGLLEEVQILDQTITEVEDYLVKLRGLCFEVLQCLCK